MKQDRNVTPTDETGNMAKKVLTPETVNPFLRSMKDVTTSPVVKRCLEIERELKKGIEKPFKKLIRTDINDTQAMGQKPLTFIRQVLTLCAYPMLLSDQNFPSDAKKRANAILDECGNRSAGAYTYSEGIYLIREHVAQYLTQRDGYPAFASNVILTSGANEALRSILNVLNTPSNGSRIGVLVPVPRDPCFSAILTEFNMVGIDYYLEEDSGWSVSLNELNTTLTKASIYCEPRAIFVNNPGNPTGSVLSSQNMEDVVRFAATRKLVLLTDESYQFNSFGQILQFQSFKKTIMQMGEPYNKAELISFMSASTGALGEFGLRSGCCELVNIREEVFNVYLKSICVKMCPGVSGQVALDCMICPPEPHEPSYEHFMQEWRDIMLLHQEKALIMINAFNTIDGIQCNHYTAATVLFLKLFIPEKAFAEAKTAGLSPDTFYAMELLENTGICVLPGILYGQLPGTYHIRVTILPEKQEIQTMIELFRSFNNNFIEKYS